jgi:integrase
MQLALFELSEPHRQKAPRADVAAAGGETSSVVPDVHGPAPARAEELDVYVAGYLQNARAPRTLLAYRSDWAGFERWCRDAGELAMPASSRTLARYLAHLAHSGRKMSSIRRTRVAIGLAHAHAGHARPDASASIRLLERGIGRELGTRERGPDPLRVEDLERLVATSRASLRDCRDRALLLVGFAGAYRASDLASLRLEHVAFDGDGVRLLLPRSKEDPMGRGRWTSIPTASRPELCAVRALRAWMQRVRRAQGPLFRVVRGGHIEPEPISTRAVARAVQRFAARAGLQGDFSAHSLRSGLATSAYARGALEREIQAHGRWKDRRSLDRYIHLERPARGKHLLANLL